MTRSPIVCLLALAFVCSAAVAQSPDAPFVEVDFETRETVPGQFVTLRVTVLVPTFMPEPPVFASFEQPNLRIRLPARSTSPTSRRIGRATWAGVSRRYEIAPLVPGRFDMPPQEIVVTYANPAGGPPLQATLATPPLTLLGTIPPGAEGLDPFIAASALELEQQVEGAPEALSVGDAVTRTVTARLAGASPISLPRLLPDHAIAGVAAYPDQPVVTETDERGALGGTRTERVTLMAEGGGAGAAPAVEIVWYNLETGRIETAVAEGFELSVEGPPVMVTDEQRLRPMVLFAVAATIALIAAVLVAAVPRYRAWAGRRRSRYRASEPWAFRRLLKFVRARDYRRTLDALDVWAQRTVRLDPRRDAAVSTSLARIGSSLFGASPTAPAPAAWRELEAALVVVRRRLLMRDSTASALPQLNPAPALPRAAADR